MGSETSSPAAPLAAVSADVAVTYPGERCTEDLSIVEGDLKAAKGLGTSVLALCDVPLSDYDLSDEIKFLKLMLQPAPKYQKIWKRVNFIACHGGFIRNVIHSLRTHIQNPHLTKTLLDIEPNNLFMVNVKSADRDFYLIRHCARQYQGKWESRVTADPACVRVGGKICGEEAFRDKLTSVWETHLHEGDLQTVGVYSSCLRRASETAMVVLQALREHAKEQMSKVQDGKNQVRKVQDGKNQVIVLPFCREKKNVLGHIGMDVLNTCVPQSLKNMKKATVCPLEQDPPDENQDNVVVRFLKAVFIL